MAMQQLVKRFGAGANGAKVVGTLAIAVSLALTACESPEQPRGTAPVETAPIETVPEATVPEATAPIAPGSAPTDKPAASETSQVIGEPIVSNHALIPGRHCYSIASDVLTAAIGVTVTEDDRVLGESQGTIHNETAGYFSGYVQTFDGSIEKDLLNLSLKSYIEGDEQDAQEVWTLANDQLYTGRNIYDQVDCSVVQEQLAIALDYGDGVQAPADSPLQEISSAPNALTEWANNVSTRRVSFLPGTSSAVVEDGVVRADRNEYLVGAAAGQTLTLSISSLEQNAVFGVVAPDGSVLLDEGTLSELELPQSGDYSIVVGGTRGNASYSLIIEIR